MLLMIREFAQERLEQDPERAERLRAAHADCYSELALDLSERLGGQERETSLALLRLEIGNIRDAWRFWVDRGDIERLLGLIRALWALHEASGWYKAAIELANDALGVLGASDRATELAADELALRTSLARALLAVYGHGEEVERAFGQVLELAERSPDA